MGPVGPPTALDEKRLSRFSEPETEQHTTNGDAKERKGSVRIPDGTPQQRRAPERAHPTRGPVLTQAANDPSTPCTRIVSLRTRSGYFAVVLASVP